MEIGEAVKYVDQYGKEHNALITQVWDGRNNDYSRLSEEDRKRALALIEDIKETPSLNLICVVSDADKSDQYGRQIERPTSVVHKKNQAAHGRYWYVS